MNDPRGENGAAERRARIADLLREVTWEQIVADGIITGEEIDEMLRAQGCDPEELMYLYE